MFFYGDSNSRMFYDRVKSKMVCQESTLAKDEELKHSRKFCENRKNNITILNRYHGSPFNIAWGRYMVTSALYSPQRLFDTIPSQGRYFISFNHYLHFVAHHVSVYERALRALRDEIVRLLERNPQGIILLRGPHVSKREPEDYCVGDVLAQHLITIQKETFRDLQDRIIYFPTWDITVASEDTDLHPGCNSHLFDLMLHFVCGRDQ
ncbi:unnamed protein product [Candidula unifasciata]|uniref:NXPE C-terminal domain-containing protein n=1 Tax=Candidula unifasciata TaxID=100452 RepID=A0A8S3Z9Y1_9EUPU|nr:unnamed protein product [Candidula unifasciata]